MINPAIEGGCFCGAVRYTIAASDKPFPVVNCHCSMCRRTSGAPFVTWMVVPEQAFKMVQGAPHQLQSSAHGKRQFCANCGTPLTCVNDKHPEYVDVTTGSLDDPAAFKPHHAVFEDTKLPWLGVTEVIPDKAGTKQDGDQHAG